MVVSRLVNIKLRLRDNIVRLSGAHDPENESVERNRPDGVVPALSRAIDDMNDEVSEIEGLLSRLAEIV